MLLFSAKVEDGPDHCTDHLSARNEDALGTLRELSLIYCLDYWPRYLLSIDFCIEIERLDLLHSIFKGFLGHKRIAQPDSCQRTHLVFSVHLIPI